MSHALSCQCLSYLLVVSRDTLDAFLRDLYLQAFLVARVSSEREATNVGERRGIYSTILEDKRFSISVQVDTYDFCIYYFIPYAFSSSSCLPNVFWGFHYMHACYKKIFAIFIVFLNRLRIFIENGLYIIVKFFLK